MTISSITQRVLLVLVEFANRVLEEGVTPRNGNKSDEAHPPIHPIKYASNLQVSR